MLKGLQQINVKVLPKKSFKKQEQRVVIRLIIKLLIKLPGFEKMQTK